MEFVFNELSLQGQFGAPEEALSALRKQMRVHFSYPIKRSEPLYVVYIGPKITRR